MEKQTSYTENITPNTQDSANETHSKGSSLVNIEPIEGSPFTLITDRTQYNEETDKGNRCFIAVGNHRITEAYETEEEAMEQFVIQPWNMTVTLITIVMEKLIELKELNKKYETAVHIEATPDKEIKEVLQDFQNTKREDFGIL